jgi:hypothetical protein
MAQARARDDQLGRSTGKINWEDQLGRSSGEQCDLAKNNHAVEAELTVSSFLRHGTLDAAPIQQKTRERPRWDPSLLTVAEIDCLMQSHWHWG